MDACLAALDDAIAATAELDVRCCDPGRSPRLASLAEALATLRSALLGASEVPIDESLRHALLERIESAGAVVGGLQVGCCAPNRLPLYARVLDRLTAVQLELHRT